MPLAHVYLALVALGQGDMATADRELALGETLPPGTTRDLWTVARGAAPAPRGQRRGRARAAAPPRRQERRPGHARRVRGGAHARRAGDPSRLRGHLVHGRVAARGRATRTHEPDAAVVDGIVEKLPKDVLVGSLQAMALKPIAASVTQLLTMRSLQTLC